MTDHSSHRYEALDAVRGIAAVTVLISHLTPYGLMSDKDLWGDLKWLPIRILWGGHQAVILFFVLSGFSLYVMWERSPGLRNLGGYIASRIARLYPTYIASLLLAGGVLWLTTPGFDISLRSALSHLLMVGDFDFNAVNPPIWSIIHEMRISLVFPVIFYAALRWPISTMVLTVGFSTALGLFTLSNERMNMLNAAGLSSWMMSVHYATMFAAGAALARVRSRFLASTASSWPMPKSVFLILALGLYMYPFDNPWNAGERLLGDLVIMVGSGALLILALATPHALSAAPLRFLGRISFSLYLTHHACITAAKWLAGGEQANNWILWAVSIALAFPAAYLMYLLVERPSQQLGRWIRKTCQRQHPPIIVKGI
jgi:Predicted acyltransferases